MASTKRGQSAVAGYLFLTPNLLGVLAFTLIPVLASLGLSFFEWDLFTPPKFVGLHNFAVLMRDREFWYYAFNTVFLMLALPHVVSVERQHAQPLFVFRDRDTLRAGLSRCALRRRGLIGHTLGQMPARRVSVIYSAELGEHQ